MKLSNRQFAIMAIFFVIASCLVLAAWNNGWFKSDDQTAQIDQPAGNISQPPSKGWTKMGGIFRPPSDSAPTRKRDPHPNRDLKGHDWGRTPPVDLDLNPNTKSLEEAIGNEKLAYRLTSMQPAPKFDPKEFEKDPQKYLDEVAPGRINQSLPAGPDVVPIKRKGKYVHALVQGESVSLEVKVAPLMPTTFGSTSLGQFENQLTSITVQADEQGIARATFTTSGGTRGDIDIRAASPVHSDTARWLIQVKKPGTTQGSNSNRPNGPVNQK